MLFFLYKSIFIYEGFYIQLNCFGSKMNIPDHFTGGVLLSIRINNTIKGGLPQVLWLSVYATGTAGKFKLLLYRIVQYHDHKFVLRFVSSGVSDGKCVVVLLSIGKWRPLIESK